MLIIVSCLIILAKCSISYSGNLMCDETMWSAVRGNFNWTGNCIYENMNVVHSAMAWVGENLPTSLSWDDYTFDFIFRPTIDSGNGGVAWRIQTVNGSPDGGQYYAISLMLQYSDRVDVVLGKWDNSYKGGKKQWSLEEPHNLGRTYRISVESQGPTFFVSVDGILLGNWTDTEDPIYLYGSVGMRNYQSPAQYDCLCVNCKCLTDEDESNSVGGWIFIGCVLGGLFLYCVVGYGINGYRSKNWGDCKGNIPNFNFWKILPKLTVTGCIVSFEFCKGKCRKDNNFNETDAGLINDEEEG